LNFFYKVFVIVILPKTRFGGEFGSYAQHGALKNVNDLQQELCMFVNVYNHVNRSTRVVVHVSANTGYAKHAFTTVQCAKSSKL